MKRTAMTWMLALSCALTGCTEAELSDVGSGSETTEITEKYSEAQLEEVRGRVREFFPFLGEYVMREMYICEADNRICIGAEVGTDIPAFTEELMEELDIPEIDEDIFYIYEFDPADEVYYLTGQ